MRYDYKCNHCEVTFEARHPMIYDGPVACPTCAGEDTRKIISVPTSIVDWKVSESLTYSTRYRAPVLNRLLRHKEKQYERTTES